LLPKRADPVSGTLVGTIVLGAFLALPVLIIALIVWIVVRAGRRSSSPGKPEMDPEFSSRFHDLEDGILDANAKARPKGSRRWRPRRDQ
jgi:hypothetical protein